MVNEKLRKACSWEGGASLGASNCNCWFAWIRCFYWCIVSIWAHKFDSQLVQLRNISYCTCICLWSKELKLNLIIYLLLLHFCDWAICQLLACTISLVYLVSKWVYRSCGIAPVDYWVRAQVVVVWDISVFAVLHHKVRVLSSHISQIVETEVFELETRAQSCLRSSGALSWCDSCCCECENRNDLCCSFHHLWYEVLIYIIYYQIQRQ